MSKKLAPHGLWKSPITPSLLGRKIRLDDVQWDSDGKTLLWVEGRSGHGVLVAKTGDDAARDLTGDIPVKPTLGYGGGEFNSRANRAIFASGGRLYKISLKHGLSQPITPKFGELAAPVISPDNRHVLYVHSYEGKDSLALANLDGENFPQKVAQGADFYMQPVWHPSGKKFAWVEWDHPQMPWDGTRLALSDLEKTEILAGDEDTPVFQPAFSPDGRYLSYISQDGEWEQLCVYDLDEGKVRTLISNATLSMPAWVQGIRMHAWAFDSSHIFYVRNETGTHSLWVVDVETGKTAEIKTPYTHIIQLAASPVDGKLAFIGESPQIAAQVVVWEKGEFQVVKRSMADNLSDEYLPSPKKITWSAPDGTIVYGLYYPPSSASYESEGLPPVIVDIHGGPTSQKYEQHNANSRNEGFFFTSRGYGVLQVNYRGSTGYGRSYMMALHKKWGPLDVEDAVGGAEALVEQGLADPKRLVIMGGSAGGYTVLNSLVHRPGFFKAGIASYAVTNLFTLDIDTHKFESHYNASMVGVLPEDADFFKKWSAVFHADKIKDAVALFHGTEDTAVAPDQSETVAEALRANNIPHIFKMYEGEGHGWRKAETIEAFYKEVLAFLQQYVIFG
ncbi:MAG: S9 family peptidase [Anaerolineae bacterium]|jgi:dipeptidyl aminopeptidase/acylaminoacyl peptidase|nr:S9 family peptidase [Anaerolineae bacterium]MBT4311625.1 S9 family peptidase [Anaerolineae bacterium]MBT4457719.1 S9 family peptidase [Anaerolineae bacterium]MBT6061982.1 S9 family peptidase [Anaerolineae bacterium]MBT6324309.1 S9 family peptidase [Anaerolineae bacterium]